MLSLFLSSPPPTPPPGGVRDFFHVLRPAAVAFFRGRGRRQGRPAWSRPPVSPSSVACGATFPLKGEGYYARCDALGGTS